MSAVDWIVFVLSIVLTVVVVAQGMWFFYVSKSYEIPDKPGHLGFQQAVLFRAAMFAGFTACALCASSTLFWGLMHGNLSVSSLVVIGIFAVVMLGFFAVFAFGLRWQTNEECRAIEESRAARKAGSFPRGPYARQKYLLGGRIKIPMPLRREDWE